MEGMGENEIILLTSMLFVFFVTEGVSGKITILNWGSDK